MAFFRITVDVECASEGEAYVVAGERLGHDEDYGFPYQLSNDTVTRIED